MERRAQLDVLRAKIRLQQFRLFQLESRLLDFAYEIIDKGVRDVGGGERNNCNCSSSSSSINNALDEAAERRHQALEKYRLDWERSTGLRTSDCYDSSAEDEID